MHLRVLPTLVALAVLLTTIGLANLDDTQMPIARAGAAQTATAATPQPTAPAATATAVATAPAATATTAASSTIVTTPTPPDLAISSVSANPDPVAAGQILNLFVTILNQGGTPTSIGTYFNVPIPAGTTINSLPGNCFESPVGTIRCAVPTLLPGQQTTYSLNLNVTATSGAISSQLILDPDSQVLDADRSNNFATRVVGVFPTQPASTAVVVVTATAGPATQTAVPTGVPVEPTAVPVQPTAPPPTPVSPAPATQLWLEVLAATPAFSVDMDPLWTAQPGEFYYVLRQEDDWVLAAWEGDPPAWAVWIQVDNRVRLSQLARPVPVIADQLWLVVFSPTPAYSVDNVVLWTAAPGEWYRITTQDGNWVLAYWENDPPEWSVWIEVDDRIQITSGDPAGPPR